MLDIKFLINNISFVINKIKTRLGKFDINNFLNIYFFYKKILFETEFMQYKKKLLTKKFILYNKNIYHIKYLKYFINIIKENIIFKKKKLKYLLNKFNKLLLFIPNIPSEDVPIGFSDKENKIIYNYGIIKKYNFNIIDHVKFGSINNNIDFISSSIISGSLFSVLRNDMSLLYRALSQFMLDVHTRLNNYCEIYVPYIVKDLCLYGTGQLPKFKDDIYYIYNSKLNNRFCLIPTAEVSLVNLFKDKILFDINFPIKLVSCTPCFRCENKSYGVNNRGLIRLNQFDKVELIQIVKPEFSYKALEELTLDAEKILKMLKLPYRKVLLSSGSMGFSSSKTYDLEVWSPITKSYIEVSSCSNTLDFQSRRINLRYKDISFKKKIFLHIINGSGLAIGRTLVSIIENFQIKSGIVKIPKVLLKYMNNKKYINCLN